MNDYSTAMVCTDCYFAHHYGVTEAQTKDGTRYFAGESDTFADREPLTLVAEYDLADNTDSNTGEGLEDFSWSSCDGCGSTLGGARFRLALFTKNPA
jgi:hypothetical protein